jgi:hypothetical protein
VHAERVREVVVVVCEEWREVTPSHDSKLIIVADLGQVKAYKLDFTPNYTPRLEQMEEIVLEEAHSRLLDRVTDGREVARQGGAMPAPAIRQFIEQGGQTE